MNPKQFDNTMKYLFEKNIIDYKNNSIGFTKLFLAEVIANYSLKNYVGDQLLTISVISICKPIEEELLIRCCVILTKLGFITRNWKNQTDLKN